MKSKLLYILVLILTVELCVSLELDKQHEAAQTAKLQQSIITLTDENNAAQGQIDELEAQVQELQAEVERKEAEKTDRGGNAVRYKLTDAERDLIERVVMAEAGGESYEGQVLVAQCILNACEIDGIRPAEAIKRYVYAKSRPEPIGTVVSAVEAVFDRGETATSEPIIYFYAPGKVKSRFHESQRFICQVGGHRFFTVE